MEDASVHEALFHDGYLAARRAALVYAAAAVVASALPGADRADLAQEALLDLWRALPKFDPVRASLRTFAERVVASRIASVVRAQQSIRRRQVSMEVPPHCEHPGSSVELRIDVERALAVLRDDDRRLARLLSEYSPTEASRILRTSRSTVYLRINRIRQAFRDAGLGPERISS
jgi:RNA polymerase sigma-70 factor, ECF subfamily